MAGSSTLLEAMRGVSRRAFSEPLLAEQLSGEQRRMLQVGSVVFCLVNTFVPCVGKCTFGVTWGVGGEQAPHADRCVRLCLAPLGQGSGLGAVGGVSLEEGWMVCEMSLLMRCKPLTCGRAPRYCGPISCSRSS